MSIVRERRGRFGIATYPSARGDLFVAWGRVGDTTGENPIDEPGDDVWFNFGKTREEAINRLLAELQGGEA